MSHETCKIVRIQSSDKASQGDFVEINAEDFDESVHVLYEGKPPVAPPPALSEIAPPTAAPVIDTPPTAPTVDEEIQKLVGELGIDISQIQGTGENGAITMEDVEKFLEESTGN